MTQIYTAQKKLTSNIMYEQIKILEKDILSNTNQKKAGMAMALSNTVDLKANKLTRDRDRSREIAY